MGHGSKEYLPGDPFHLLNGFPESAFIFHCLVERVKLFGAQRHGNGFASDFARPLVTAARGLESGAIQNGALADVTHVSQALAQAVVVPFQKAEAGGGLFHIRTF